MPTTASKATSSTFALPPAVRALVLSVLLFTAAFGAHEVMHLLVLYAVGGHGSIVVRPWLLASANVAIPSLHVQPDQPIGLLRQLLVNFLGPILAAIPFAALLSSVREPVARIALIANVAILVFYGLIEAGDLLLESLVDFDAAILTTPEFNYGVPALIILIAVVAAVRHKTDVQVATG